MRYLFSHITMSAIPWESDNRDLCSFLERCPEVVFYVRSFTWETCPDRAIVNVDDLRGEILEDYDGTPHPVNPPFLRLPIFPNVTTFRWSTDRKRPLQVGPAISLFVASFPSVTSLSLHATFPHVSAVEEFLSLFGKNLRRLEFGLICEANAAKFLGLMAPASNYTLEHLENLILSGPEVEHHWIPFRLLRFEAFLPKKLKTIEIHMDTIDAVLSGQLLDMFSSSLEDITLGPPWLTNGNLP